MAEKVNEFYNTDGEIDGAKVLEIPMGENDAAAKTVKSYLVALLSTLWTAGEGFSGKRPFGNSGWEYELYRALVASGAAKGTIDPEYGDLGDVDKDECAQLIFAAIDAL